METEVHKAPDAAAEVLAAAGYAYCKRFDDVPFGVSLWQHKTRKNSSFAVQYGCQIDVRLTYSEACAKLGQALLHAAACDSLIDNERD